MEPGVMSNPSTQTTSAKNTKYTRVGDIASGRAGDKGNVLDLTLVARDDAAYKWLARTLTADTVRRELNRVVSGPVQRFEIADLRALKYVLPQALSGGVYASLRPGLHWQKAAIWLLLDLMIEEGSGHVAWQQNL
jgi:hypothetical protein